MSKTILLVEDNDDTREMLGFYLETQGFLIVEAADGFDSIEYLYHHEPPDLILMDMSMPGLTGIETIGHIKKIPGVTEIPVICITAYGDLYKENAIEAGCKDVLAKPVDFDKLTKLVEFYIE